MIRRMCPPRPNFLSSFACLLVFTAFAAIATAAQVTATKLDGATVTGELIKWDTSELRLTTAGGDQQIPAKQVASLRWQSPKGAEAADSSGSVELIDGSILPVKDVRVDQSQATLTLAIAAAPDSRTLTIPVPHIAAIRLHPLDASLAKQWDEIRSQNLANDVIVVLKKDGKSIDYAEGVIGNIGNDKIEFKLDGELQSVDRAKIAGAIYYRPDRRMDEEPKASIQGRSGLRVNASQVELKDSVIKFTTATGEKLAWPLSDVSLADFSAGKLMYLSDIEPASTKCSPFIALPESAALAGQYGQPRRDKSAFGDPLSLVMKEGETAAARAATKTFAKGLALRSRTEIVYRLPTGFKRFIAIAGIDPATATAGNLRLTIFGDDRALVEIDVTGDQPPHPIQLDIANVKRLKIQVDFGQNLDTGDWLNLCDARIAK
jgi:hypothetical protein